MESRFGRETKIETQSRNQDGYWLFPGLEGYVSDASMVDYNEYDIPDDIERRLGITA